MYLKNNKHEIQSGRRRGGKEVEILVLFMKKKGKRLKRCGAGWLDNRQIVELKC